MVACTALGLGHLHNKSYLYRDLKPENLLLDTKGYVHIADFGLVKRLKNQETAKTFCGTSEYIAPEVLLGKTYDWCADWWSLGILMYELLFNQIPFHHEDIQKMYSRIIGDELKFPSRIKISRECKNFIR